LFSLTQLEAFWHKSSNSNRLSCSDLCLSLSFSFISSVTICLAFAASASFFFAWSISCIILESSFLVWSFKTCHDCRMSVMQFFTSFLFIEEILETTTAIFCISSILDKWSLNSILRVWRSSFCFFSSPKFWTSSSLCRLSLIHFLISWVMRSNLCCFSNASCFCFFSFMIMSFIWACLSISACISLSVSKTQYKNNESASLADLWFSCIK